MFIFKDISGAFGFNLTLGTSLSSLRRKHCVRLYAKIHRTGRKPLLGLRLGLGYLTTPFQQHFCLLLGPFLLLVLTVGGIYIGGFQAPEHTWNQKSKISSDLGFFPTLGNICLNEFLNLPENSCTEYGRLTVNWIQTYLKKMNNFMNRRWCNRMQFCFYLKRTLEGRPVDRIRPSPCQ